MLAPEITRPALRYHGGKWKLAPWIVSHFGPHATYTEAYGGGGSVLLRKPRAVGEVYNDLDGDVVNLFRVLRDPLLAGRLREQLHYTKYSREEFEAAYEVVAEPVEAARCLVVRSFQGLGGAATNPKHCSAFRSQALKGETHFGPAAQWATYPDLIPALTERLRNVVVENRPALEVLTRFDGPAALHYVDPPYLFKTRGSGARVRQQYAHEMSDNDHRELAAVLHQLRGAVVLSGYACDLYDQELFPTWHRVERATHADGARERTEVLWLNPQACAASKPTRYQPTLF